MLLGLYDAYKQNVGKKIFTLRGKSHFVLTRPVRLCALILGLFNCRLQSLTDSGLFEGRGTAPGGSAETGNCDQGMYTYFTFLFLRIVPILTRPKRLAICAMGGRATGAFAATKSCRLYIPKLWQGRGGAHDTSCAARRRVRASTV